MKKRSTRLEQLTCRARDFYDNGDPSHDITHVQRVMSSCERIGRAENANLDVLLAAALLHDIVNLPKNHPDRARASTMAGERSRELLAEVGFSEEEIEKVVLIITEHSFSSGRKASSIESAILQDADKLDALGALGILRTVTCGARMGCAYYDPAGPFAERRPLNDKAFTLDHFFVKLFKLPELMNTETARAEAFRRREFMREFLDEIRLELELA